MRVLVTGAAGRIGAVVTAGLVDLGHDVVGLDQRPAPEGWLGPWHTADCTDPDAVLDAVAEQPLDAVVHLAGDPSSTDLPTALSSHVLSTAALLDAMVARGVPRMVYASSNHAVGLTPRPAPGNPAVGTATRPRPDTPYGVGKVAAEALLSLYADRHGLDTVACRIGSFLERPVTRRHLETWLSPGDCVRLVEAALTAPAPGFAVLYGISANTGAWWDLEPGRALGYEPRDDAARYAGEVAPRPEDDAEAAHVGGDWAVVDRPALDRRH
ncbi:NAD-dependent epimerase/dehydratase family protein [Nocardioides mangrovi]|uniref:NAD(P)-dependent oxidoreductase n=1 Tax=Nocardioides mangrovi TaxID=2874580 RepID=A0ABS7UII3_9ACTN|nr:NAD(P)-dependent oxidoreductase [Nocardioides mangrovi]MBZ5740846.1 NAD(P)-dependent oxidoreductase [Nocardioides mangrovi]